MKDLVADDYLPDYQVYFDFETDNVTFTNRNWKDPEDAPRAFNNVSTSTLEKVSKLGLQVDKYALEQEFYQWIAMTDITPKSIDALFVKFAHTRKELEDS